MRLRDLLRPDAREFGRSDAGEAVAAPRTVPPRNRRIEGHGLALDLPDRWEARLYVRRDPAGGAALAAAGSSVASAGPSGSSGPPYDWSAPSDSSPHTHPAAFGWPGEHPHPVLHLGNFPLPSGRGDFGTGAVELMGPENVFLALLEYHREEAHRPLFRAAGIPGVRLSDFAQGALQRRLPGQLGLQRFFTARNRPFCLYVVLGSASHGRALVASVNAVLGNLQVAERTA